MAEGLVVRGDGCDGAEVVCFSAGQEEELVKEVEDGCAGLVDGGDDDELLQHTQD